MALRDVFIVREDRETWEALLGDDILRSIIDQNVIEFLQDHGAQLDSAAAHDLELYLTIGAAAALGARSQRAGEGDDEWAQNIDDALRSGGLDNEIKMFLRALRSGRPWRHKLDVFAQGVVTALESGDYEEANRVAVAMFNLVHAESQTQEPPAPKYNDPSNDVLKLDNGWTWRRVCGAQNKGKEGKLVRHCGDAGENDMYSLRDLGGKPHVTMAVDSQRDQPVLTQLKGKGNSQPVDKYLPACRELVDYLGVKYFSETYDEPGEADRVMHVLGLKKDPVMAKAFNQREPDEEAAEEEARRELLRQFPGEVRPWEEL